MVRVVYIDVLFLVNFLINYLMLFATGKLNGAFVSRPKLLLSAASGALYCCVVFFVELSGVVAVVMKIAAGAAMVMLSFEWRKKFLRLFLSFCGVSFAFGGCVLAACFVTRGGILDMRNGVYYLRVPLGVLLVSSAVCFVLIELVFKRCVSNGASRHIISLRITHEGKTVQLHALVDTGNNLADPITNAPVMVVEYSILQRILDARVRTVLDSADDLAFPMSIDKLPCEYKFRLLPYKTLGNSLDMLISFQPDEVWVNGKIIKGALVAISPDRISDGGAYSAIASASAGGI